APWRCGCASAPAADAGCGREVLLGCAPPGVWRRLRETLSQQIPSAQHQTVTAPRNARRERAADDERIDARGSDAQAVAQFGKDDEAFEEVISVGPPTDDVKRKVHLGRREAMLAHAGLVRSVLRQPVYPGLLLLHQRPVRAGLPLALGAPHTCRHPFGFLD